MDQSVMSNELAIGQQQPSKTRTATLVMAIVLSAAVLRVHAEDAAKPPSISDHEFPSEAARSAMELQKSK
jgi:hypothetical protein